MKIIFEKNNYKVTADCNEYGITKYKILQYKKFCGIPYWKCIRKTYSENIVKLVLFELGLIDEIK